MEPITFKVMGVPDAFRRRQSLRQWLNGVARDHGHQLQEMNYVLMTDDALLEFNRRYLDHDEYTDIITFDGQTGRGLSGDILISYDRVRENAASFGTTTSRELHRVMVHGLLHLLGYKDRTKTQQLAMREQEDHHLRKLEMHRAKGTSAKRKGHRP